MVVSVAAVADWPRCRARGCTGVSFDSEGNCVVHSSETEAWLSRLERDANQVIDLRGVTLYRHILGRIIEATRDRRGRSVIHNARFDYANFLKGASFVDVDFVGPASFRSAKFNGAVVFEGVTFTGNSGTIRYVQPAANFGTATFGGEVSFEDVEIQNGNMNFARSFCEKSLLIRDVRIKEGNLTLQAAHVSESLTLDGPVAVEGALILNGIRADGPCGVSLVGRYLDAQNSIFANRLSLSVQYATIDLGNSNLGPAATIQLVQHGRRRSEDLDRDNEIRAVEFIEVAGSDRQRRGGYILPEGARLVSLERVQVTSLVLVDIDLRRCLFQGIHGTEGVRFEGRCEFASPPKTVVSWRWPFVLRFSPRRMIFEEICWRAGRGSRRFLPRRVWQDSMLATAKWYYSRAVMQAQQGYAAEPTPWGSSGESTRGGGMRLAVIYRQLRKSLEDAKDNPGASDFYYAEMEMRRLTAGVGERALLSAYWLLAGYATRPLRAFFSLLVVVVIGTMLMAGFGLAVSPGERGIESEIAGPRADETAGTTGPDALSMTERLSDSAKFALNAVIFRSAEQQATEAGSWINLALRFVGPILLGLLLLSIRNKVKR